MKKSTLALSVAAAIGSFGLIGNAFAIGTLQNTTGADTATIMRLNTDGIGHQLVVPYFTAQSGNATMLNITNTDTVNAKAVKVRFRAAANSDDIFDFTLLLSPGDVWTSAVSQDPTTGLSLLKTTDASCVLPPAVKASTGALFITNRVDPTPAKGSSTNETREGYVEIINMANIPTPSGYAVMSAAQKAATLFGTIKHINAVAACDATVLGNALGNDFASFDAAVAGGLAAPTGGLSADWVILNQTTTASWSGAATALQVVDAATGLIPSVGTLAFWPQKAGTPLLAANAAQLAARKVTADPLFVTGAVAIQNYDLPDLSTSYTSLDNGTAAATDNVSSTNTAGPAVRRADNTSSLLAVKSIANQFVTNSGIAGVTDMLFSQPTRRYSVAVNYTASGTTASTVTDIIGAAGNRAVAIYRGVGNLNGNAAAIPLASGGSAYYTVSNTALVARQVCLNSISAPAFFDREESQAASQFVISPGIAATFSLCGEAAIASINAAGVVAGSALNATVVRNDVTFGAGYDLGWATFDTTNGGNALPILSSSLVRVANGSVNYGFTLASKVTR